MQLSYEELNELYKISKRNNEADKIITFKTFIPNINQLDHLNGKINAFLTDFKYFFSVFFSDEFDTKVYITHHFDTFWKASCFSLISGAKIFNLFSFFKVNEVNINIKKKSAEIKLELVGKYEIFEERFCEKKNENIDYNVIYDENNNVIKLV